MNEKIKNYSNENKNKKIEKYFSEFKKIINNLNNVYKKENYEILYDCVCLNFDNIINIVNKSLIFSINEIILKTNNFKEKYFIFLNNLLNEIKQSKNTEKFNNKKVIINNFINNKFNEKIYIKKKNNSIDNSNYNYNKNNKKLLNKNLIKIKKKLELNNSLISNSNENRKKIKYNLKRKIKNNSVLNSNNNNNTIDNTYESNKSFSSYNNNNNNNLNFSFSSNNKKENLKITELNPISSLKLIKFFPFYKNRNIIVQPKPTNQTKNILSKSIKILTEYKEINHKLSKSKEKK